MGKYCAKGCSWPQEYSRKWALVLALSLPAVVLATNEPGAPAARKPAAHGTPKASAAKSEPGKPVTSAKPRRQAAPASGSSKKADGAAAFIPIAATSGGLGLFTLENGELLPRRGFSGSIFASRFGRQAGSLTILNAGWNFAYGFRERFSVFVQMEPYRHLAVGNRSQLSVLTPLTNPQFGTTMYRSLLPVVGSAPGYAEDFPHANRNASGFGEVALGMRFALAQERLGHAVNFSVGYDFFFPTRTDLPALLDNQVQLGTFGHGPAWSLSRTWNEWVATTFGGSYRFTGDAETLGVKRFVSADQLRFGVGLHFLPQKRFQIINEYNALVFSGKSTPNTTFGARDPLDGIWGFRYYFGKRTNFALDAGYRHMLNLSDHHDRSGFVLKLAATHWKPAPQAAPLANREPLVSCTVSPASVTAGMGETVRGEIRATDADGDALSYQWSASGGTLEGSGAQVRWNPGNAAPGMYTLAATAKDGKGGSSSCTSSVRVEPRPNRAPALACATPQRSYLPGERAPIRGVASDADGDALSYGWRANGGTIAGRGENVQLDTSGLSPGAYAVTGRVEDGRGGAADCTVIVTVQAPAAPPQATKVNECYFRAASVRVDNVCKRILDDAALRLQNDPRGQVVLVGYADAGEAKTLGGQRAAAVKQYLASRGIAETRISTREGSGRSGAGKENRRVDLIWAPEGARF